MLKVNRCLARRCNLKEGFSARIFTIKKGFDAIEYFVFRCISKATLKNFSRKIQGLLKRLLMSTVRQKVNIHGLAVNLSIMTLDYFIRYFWQILHLLFLVLNGHLNQIGLFLTRCGLIAK